MIARLWRSHRLALIAFVVAALVSLVLAGRTVAFYVYWADSGHIEQPVESWMTVGYVARSWKVDPDLLRAVLDLDAGDRRPIGRIARDLGIAETELLAKIDAAIAEARAGSPRPSL